MRDRKEGGGFRGAGRPGREAAAPGPQAEAAGTQKEERQPQDRLRSADRIIQVVRWGPNAGTRADGDGVDIVPRSGTGHVAMAHCSALRVLARFVSGH